jgi:hypothetical protein
MAGATPSAVGENYRLQELDHGRAIAPAHNERRNVDRKQELKRWLRTLASFRAEVESEAKWVEEYKAALEASEPWRLYQQVQAHKIAVQDCADEAADYVRIIALELYGDTHDKHPSPAVTIQETKDTVTVVISADLSAYLE